MFLDMLAWSEELITDVRNQKSWLWRHCRRRAIYWLLRSPSQTCHAKPKTQINRRRTLPVSFPLVDAYRKQLGLKDFSPKVRTLWHCSRLRSVALYLWLIVADIRCGQLTVAISGLHCWALVMVSSSIRLTAWLKIQRSGRNGQRDWCMSRVTAIISALVICIIVCPPRLLIIVDNAITYKAQRDKCQRTEAGERGTTDMQMRQRAAAALDAKYTKELADAAKLKMMLCVMMLPLVVVGCTSKPVCQSVRKPPSPPAWIMRPRLADTAERDYFTLRERLITMQKQLGEPRSILMSSADRVAHIDGQLMQLLWAIHTRLQRSINAQSNKTEQSIYECLLACLITFSAPPQILRHRQFSSAQFQKRRNDGWWFPGATAAGLFWTVNVLLSTSCNKQAWSLYSIFFMVLSLML